VPAAARAAQIPYYAWRKRACQPALGGNERLRKTLAELFEATRGGSIGSPRLTVCLRRKASSAVASRGPARCASCASKPAKNGPSKTQNHRASSHPSPANWLAVAPKTSQRLIGSGSRDITLRLHAQGWLYLAAVMDLYSRNRRLGPASHSWKHPGERSPEQAAG